MSLSATLPSYKERLRDIVYLSFSMLRQKIAGKEISATNEASLQHQFSVILKQVGELYLFASQDRLDIELERDIELNEPTNKSPKKSARCDIWLTMRSSDGASSSSAAIEIKYFKRGNFKKGVEATTDNRFALLFDLENLEEYRRTLEDDNLLCYEVVYTNNPNYANEKSTKSNADEYMVKLAPTIQQKANRTIQRRTNTRGVITINQVVDLDHEYKADWISYDQGDNTVLFLLVDLQREEHII